MIGRWASLAKAFSEWSRETRERECRLAASRGSII